ncbi:unnamed protein product [Rotaria sordida]|uniref:Uncharacterized protein n=1 Tax=Rotaria sordida TaxID=392033 RepID=A0A814URM8_9BILA|nr:unnamed protein product [Rotaria sordida]
MNTIDEFDGIIINCTVYPIILQSVPNRIVGTMAIANMSSEEIYWNHVHFETGVQFPLKFLIIMNDYEMIPDKYILQLHIYELPRENYDLPLWSADKHAFLQRNDKPNFVDFFAHSDREPTKPCLMGVIVNTEHELIDIKNNELLVKIGTMPSIKLNIHRNFFPILFTITDIPKSQGVNSTFVTVLITNPLSIIAYEARQSVMFNIYNECTTLLFKVAEERNMNLTVSMSAHVFTSVSLFSLGATYKIYKNDYLLFEKTELIDKLEFPIITSNTLVPITTATNYTIAANIFGPIPGFSSGGTLFEGVTYTRLVPGTNNNIKISMIYIGPKIGTTIVGKVQQTPVNQSTWPLAGTNLVFTIADQTSGLDESDQFIIFDQTFPIHFTLLAIKSIKQNHQNVLFTITITNHDGTVLWIASTENNQIMYGQLNRLNINVKITANYTCRSPGQGWCSSVSSNNLNAICCSQYKCSGECKLPW